MSGDHFTRNRTFRVGIGYPSDLDRSVLPTYRQVIAFFFFFQAQMTENNFPPKQDTVCQLVAAEITKIWSLARVPTIQDKSIYNKVNRLMNEVRKYLKSPKTRKRSQFPKENLLFDLSRCRCFQLLPPDQLSRVSITFCGCSPTEPWNHEFYLDQLHDRKMVLSGGTNSKLNRCDVLGWDNDVVHDLLEDNDEKGSCYPPSDDNGNDDDQEEQDDDGSPDYVPKAKRRKTDYNTNTFPLMAAASIRHGVSPRATSEIFNAGLADLGILDNFKMVDRMKMVRERKKIGEKESQQQKFNSSNLIGIAFDERKDRTAVRQAKANVIKTGKKTSIIQSTIPVISKETHCVVMGIPNNQYLDTKN